MNVIKRLNRIFASADVLPFNDSSRFIIMSDCHRGDGSWADDFLKNQNLFFAALTSYYNKGYTYIELGDGDELWENKQLDEIKSIHSDSFWLLSKFYKSCRLYLLYGNHDIVKKNPQYVANQLFYAYDENKKIYCPLFPNIKLHEGLVLHHVATGGKILLVHGHQADFLNSTLWKLARFLVRYVWRPLELVGIRDPLSASKNSKIKDTVEKGLTAWVEKEQHPLIAGHTHRPVFPEADEPHYFNDGCCVHPRCITGIEIAEGAITLVKWSLKSRPDGVIYVGRDILVGPRKLQDYFEEPSSLTSEKQTVS